MSRFPTDKNKSIKNNLNKMREFLTWCSRYLSVPAIIIIGVLCYILFFQEYSVGRIYDNNRTIDSLERAIARETDTLNFYLDKNRRLDNRDPETVERIVREHHDMALPTEEVYVFK